MQRVAVDGGAELNIRSLLDSRQYADPGGQAAAAGISPASWPLFGQVWPSSQKLADLMQRWPLGDRRVLEIGCGLALASLVIRRRGGNVTASDCHPLAASFLHENTLLNGLSDLHYQVGHWQRTNPHLGEFDLIVGSDVLYEPGLPAELADFIDEHAAAQAEVLIVDPDRANRGAFRRHMARLGFGLSETPLHEPLADGSRYHGRLMHYRRAVRPRA